jgi:hypothetical protein
VRYGLVTLAAVWTLAIGVSPAGAQARRATPAPATKTEPAQMQCPAPLGTGVQTMRLYCDVLTGNDPAAGIIITLPPHTGPVTLRFDLHNRHLYSEDLVKANRAYRRYLASIGVMTADVTLLTRAAILSEFRSAADLVDRIAGDAGVGGVKAVAPIGVEPIMVTIPAAEKTVSILGEKLQVTRPDGTDDFRTPGRPVAIISNVTVEYRPAPAPRAPARPARRR